MMSKPKPIHLLVSAVFLLAVLGVYGSTQLKSVNPGSAFEIICFIIVALILERSGNTLRIQGKGSTSFVITLCAAVLFGGAWAALIIGCAMFISKLSSKQPAIKIIFNTAQMMLSIICAAALYQMLGGQTPPSYLSVSTGVPTAAVQLDFALFFVLAAVYF